MHSRICRTVHRPGARAADALYRDRPRLGVAVGAVLHGMAASPAEAKEIAGYFTIGTDIFLRRSR